jgi:UDP-N-acetylmuramate--alanine ligase
MGGHQKDSHLFIYECDEYDRNFLAFHPKTSILTSIDYDHPDIYPTRESYQAAFRDFCDQSQNVICWQKDADVIGLASGTNTKIIDDDTDLQAITLAGDHTRQNAWLAIQAVQELTNTPLEKLVEIINRFPGTGRRFEKLANNIYSDYAHHPAEIKATLQMARELSDEVIVLYQPHQNTRQHAIKAAYTDSFKQAAKVY